MDWQLGTRLKVGWLPEIYTVVGPPFTNEIGYRMVPLLNQNGSIDYFHHQTLTKAIPVTDNGEGGIFGTPGKAIDPFTWGKPG